MRIANLRQHPGLIPTLAAWHHQQWGVLNPQNTLEGRIARLERGLERGLDEAPLPVTFVALEGEEPLGSASLVEHDLATRPELSPWLASVYVAVQHRRQGIGGRLVQRVVEEAGRLNFEKLYLFTLDQEHFYEELGWILVERSQYNGFPIAIMSNRPASR